MDGFEGMLARKIALQRCFHCGGVLVGLHLCPGCLQLVHPGCECTAPAGGEQVGRVVLAGGYGLPEKREREEE